ncbi:glycoside hydrolase family 97 protein [Segetibacter aerophilus]|uniref:Alpha-glucosidase n=1 Tax=Segetibacter aerophilus TaxID=670293 RepID=A0A512BIM6_9BACT|nr:glycoside hydrolase family 97 protein [Segetibacter aerophilus]GEO11829.1 alpha-glucosidase [Segetibacter aerophilus]
MNKISQLLLLLVISIASFGQEANSYKVASPDKSTLMEVRTGSGGKLMYRVLYAGKEAITWSAMGFVMNGMIAGEQTAIQNKTGQSHKEKFAWPLGEDDTITNNYNELRIVCTSSILRFNLIARAYDGSVAFRYDIPTAAGSASNTINKELTEFRFLEPFTLYQYNHESVFTPVTIDTFNKTCDFPATITNGKLFVSIGEGNNVNYTKAELKRGANTNSLATAFMRDSAVKFTGPYQTPWRTVSVATSAVGLHKYSQLFLKLNPASAKGVPAWIKPGKLIRSQLNTQSGLDCIDFAAKHSFQYIMFDAGWYGAEFRGTSDPTQVIPQIDMPAVIQHAKSKGIGVILYVNYVGLKAKLDTILPLYKKWGVSGLKFGFVDGLTQAGLTWLASAIKKVNDYGFILDIHDNYKPTGLSRTYPALLTQEGIRGDENSPDAFHTTVLPFTRFLAGPADFTFCYPNSKNSFSKNLKVSMGQQLALSVIYFSPLQAIFWYGQPDDYTNEGEIEFFTRVPTVWNESHYLAGDIGKNISVARRKGNTWYIGNAAGPIDWRQNISLNFLPAGKRYRATVYEDDGQGSIRKRTVEVKKGDKLTVSLTKETGEAIILEPIAK